MTTQTPVVYVITDAPPRPKPGRGGGWRLWLRLALIAVLLLVTAADEWVTSVLGVRPLLRLTSEVRTWADTAPDEAQEVRR
ncbi:unnamed protein product [[Actinomadura] parvosata subsp. kistnae]|uniref:hypothetical protein n=1 Tax=[Actinomadura] parvosata TaxID=1955412 RepID=UPI000D2E983C|nr:hypothetical protein [Nonomuraea sp. ATCC 55076]SPL94137.1 unnamed protein product [Actinomadura parvosata subsp. kistnae]